jgi:predicted unusual protein kinase regulating ubiquinone biosynthesis (AarF/ABC1/UbiB family)
MRDQIVGLLLDISEDRGDAAGEKLVEMGQTIDEFDRPGFVREVASLVARNHDRTVGEIRAGIVLYEMINIAYQRGLKLPAELTLLAKAVFNLDIVSRSLDPTYSPTNAIRDYANNILNERARQEFSPRRMFQLAMQTSDLVNALPHRLDLITQKLATNDLGLRVDAPQLTVLLKGLQKIANRVFSGLVLCGLLIASAMLMPYRRSIATTGFFIAAAIAVYMVLSILVSDRKKQ